MNIYPPGSLIAGRYEVASRPMMGGMGVVYFCLDREEDRPVALKTFKPEFLPDRAARDRFLREGAAWVALGTHPHIVRCYNVEYVDPVAFLSLELVAGEQDREDVSLRTWIVAPLAMEQALLFAWQIAQGLAYAHEKIPCFVHRDLKPENVLVGADKLPGMNINRLRVTDFGLSAVLDAKSLMPLDVLEKQDEGDILRKNHLNLLSVGNSIGTPEYMAPEQWERGKIDFRADVYALGCVLLEMLSGQVPVRANPRKACRELHRNGEALHKVSTAKGVSRDIKSLLKNCLAVDPAERYLNWPQLITDLEEAYAAHTGKPAPQAVMPKDLSRDERMQVGWSYNTIGMAYGDIDKAEVAVTYFEKALLIAEELGNQDGKQASLTNLGNVYISRGDINKAIGCLEQSLVIARDTKDLPGEAAAFGNLGDAYKNLGDIKTAIDYYEKYLSVARETGNFRREGNALTGLGNSHLTLGDARRAIGYYEQALAIHDKIGNQRGESAVLNSMGEAYRTLGDIHRAIGYHENALAIARGIGNQQGEAGALGYLGVAYKNLGDARRAIGYLEQCLRLLREIGDRRGVGITLGNLGNAHAKLGEVQQALEYYEQALTIRREIGAQDLVASVSLNMAMLYAQQGDAVRALPLAQEAAQIFAQMGSTNAQIAQQLVARLQNDVPVSEQADPYQAAFEAFLRAGDPQAMQATVKKFPLLRNEDFIPATEQMIKEQVPPNLQPAFKQRLAWLKQITGKQKTGFFDRLLGKKE